MEISSLLHFSHNHRLYLRYNIEERDICGLCRLPISSEEEEEESHYGCEYECQYYIHSSCAKFPKEMVHPFHPNHTLTLQLEVDDDPMRYASLLGFCYFCGCKIGSVFFQCSECRLIRMDLNCAAKPIEEGDLYCTTSSSTLPRSLFIYANIDNIRFHFRCCFCWLPIIATEGPVVFGVLCEFFMHESCAEVSLLSELQHILHPQHPLKPSVFQDFICDACGKDNSTIFSFGCDEKCNFNLHLGCALLRPTTNEGHREKDDEDHHHHVNNSHSPLLIECYRKKNSVHHQLSCSGCTQLFKEEESIYVCLPLKQLLHKSCAQAPRQIDRHPFHLAHPLSLLDETPNCDFFKSYNCMACKDSSRKLDSHFYRCCDCNFTLHTKCALPVVPILFLNSQAVLHQHPLALLNVDIKKGLPCTSCKGACYYPFFRCVECDFNLHVHCLSVLPPTVNHKCHLHPLTLTHSPVNNHEDDAEFYCNACEECRLLDEPTYYCVECHYVAHVHCVISEVIPYVEREYASLADKLEEIKLDEAFDVDAIAG